MIAAYHRLQSDYALKIKAIINRWPEICLSALAIFGFFLSKKILLLGEHASSSHRLIYFFLICMMALSGSAVKMAEFSWSLRILLRGIIVLFALYLLCSVIPVPVSELSRSARIEAGLYGWLVPVIGIVACFRLSWAVPFFVAAKWQKALVAKTLLMNITPTDYTPLIEIGLLLSIGSLIYVSGRRFANLWQDDPENRSQITTLDTLLLTGLAVHFANYFYSAVQKFLISAPVWQWVWDNPTYNLALIAWKVGALPLTLFGDHFVSLLLQYFLIPWNMPLNIAIMFGQLLSIFALTRIRWAIVLTIFYDLTHIVIFLVSGIFFYKWIVLNLLLIVVLTRIKNRHIPHHIKFWLAGVLLLAPTLFFVAFLGWFDSPSFNDEYVEAVTESGKIYRVPSNYFLAGSVTHAQQRFEVVKPGHFPTGAYGAMLVKNKEAGSFAQAQSCTLPLEKSSGIATQVEKDHIVSRLRSLHNYILQRVDKKGRFPYDLYPHHIFSMAWPYWDFYLLDKRRIVSYRYVVESDCIGFKDGRLTSRTLLRGEYDVPVK